MRIPATLLTVCEPESLRATKGINACRIDVADSVSQQTRETSVAKMKERKHPPNLGVGIFVGACLIFLAT